MNLLFRSVKRVNLLAVMPALVAGIHVFLVAAKTWMAGVKPGHDD
jgi:hypothetical protein